MTIYAPTDIHSVTVPADDGRGCGQPHARTGGTGPFALSCEACEPHLLATDSRWVRTVADVQETYDQKKERESLAIRGGRDREDILTLALARLAGLDLPPSLAGATERLGLSGAVPGSLACPAGHLQPGGQAYCGACGLPMRGTAGEEVA